MVSLLAMSPYTLPPWLSMPLDSLLALLIGPTLDTDCPNSLGLLTLLFSGADHSLHVYRTESVISGPISSL